MMRWKGAIYFFIEQQVPTRQPPRQFHRHRPSGTVARIPRNLEQAFAAIVLGEPLHIGIEYRRLSNRAAPRREIAARGDVAELADGVAMHGVLAQHHLEAVV